MTHRPHPEWLWRLRRSTNVLRNAAVSGADHSVDVPRYASAFHPLFWFFLTNAISVEAGI